MKPNLGDRVRFSQSLVRNNNRNWVVTPHPEKEGVYVGARTQSNGHFYWDGEGLGHYIPDAYFKSYLISTGDRVTISVVRPEDCTVIQPTTQDNDHAVG